MQSRYIYFVNLFLIYFKWFQIYPIERTKRTSIYSTQEVVILSRKPETHFIVLVCWLCDLIYKILSSFTETIFSFGAHREGLRLNKERSVKGLGFGCLPFIQ